MRVRCGAQCIWVKAVDLVASYRRGICVPWGAFLDWRTAQQIGRCLESAVRSPCNISGSVLPSGYLIACLIPTTVRLYVVCWRQICILLLLIVLAALLKSRMRSMECKVVQFSNSKCWEPHRFPCKSSFAICVSDIWRYGGKLIFHVLARAVNKKAVTITSGVGVLRVILEVLHFVSPPTCTRIWTNMCWGISAGSDCVHTIWDSTRSGVLQMAWWF